MKKPIFLLLAAVLATLQAGALDLANAQVHEVVNAPEWFFNPAQGEYVGVSLPLKNAELAQQQAVYAALLSYVAQSNVVVNFQNAANSTAISEEAEHLVEVVSENLFILPSSYKIIKTAVNQYGEHFVSLNVIPSQDSSIRMFVRHYYFSSTKKNGSEKNEEKMTFALEDKSSPNVEVNVYGSYTSQGDSAAEEQVEYGVQHAQESEIFASEKKYDYRSTMAGALYEEPFWGMCPLRHSLGVAYTQALLNGIIHDCVSKGKRTGADPSKITKSAREALKQR